jgi:Ca2+-binding EF-hand superfamily protein
MVALGDFLTIEAKGPALPGNRSLTSTERPTLAGLKWLDAPPGVTGLAYRVNGSLLERLSVTSGDESIETDGGSSSSSSSPGTTVVCSCPLPADAVNIAASHDGRMVAVACIDGSLRCFDSTHSALALRWTIPNAHSHVSHDVNSPVSADRSRAACASGPVLALAFSPTEDYFLLLVDAATGLAIYDARVKPEPSNVVVAGAVGDGVSSASWCNAGAPPSSPGVTAATTQKHGTALLAVGKYDGTVEVFRFTAGSVTSPALLLGVSQLGSPCEEDGFSCTHLNWSGDALVAGLCRVIPPEDNEEADDDDDELDDSADHEVCLYVTTIDESSLSSTTEWMKQGDVVPFFTVPKCGRHVYFTAFLRSKQSLIAVASNVGESVGAIARDGTTWTLVEFQEGSGATTPTNEDDEFTYPAGLAVVQLPSTSFRLLLAATDGSLSTFAFENENDPNCFLSEGLIGSKAGLPDDPVAMLQAAALAPPPPRQAASPSGDDNGNGTWVVVDEEKDPEEGQPASATGNTHGPPPTAALPSSAVGLSGPTPSLFGSSSSMAFRGNKSSFGSGTQLPSFGSGSQPPSFGPTATPAFGSGTAGGLTFGTGSTLSLASTTQPIIGGFQFGSTSALGGGVTSSLTPGVVSTPTKLGAFGSTSSVFGSGSGVASGGFAALSSSSPSGTGFGALGSDPFNAFQKTPSPFTGAAFMAKPLFGSSSTSGPTSSNAATDTAFATPRFGVDSGDAPSKPAFGSSFGATSLAPTTPEPSAQNPSIATLFSPSPVVPTASDPATTSPVTPKTPDPSSNESEKAGLEDRDEPDASVATDSGPRSTAEMAALRVFDSFDGTKVGSVPVSHFEAMSEELGEGFHGDEYEAQIALIDPSRSGSMTRSAFAEWYKTLVASDASDGSDTLDTEEREERAQEERTAKEAFGKLSTTEDGEPFITVGRFKELMESLGSTYCEEEHVKTIKTLEKPGGRIHESDFLEWYTAWLFGGDEDLDDGGGPEEAQKSTIDTSGEKGTLESLFKVDEGTWKCNVCAVRNLGSTNKCAACETPRPGYEDKAGTSDEKAKMDPSSIGIGGFSFGGNISAISNTGTGSFQFGVAPPSTEVKATSGGFLFASSESGAGSVGETKSGFLFVAAKKDDDTKDSTVVRLAGDSLHEPGSATSDPVGFKIQLPEGKSGSGAPPFAISKPDSSSDPTVSRDVSEGGDSNLLPSKATPRVLSEVDAKELIGAEKSVSVAAKSAACVFDKLDSTQSGSLPIASFEQLSEELGEGFHGDEYDAQVAIMDPSKSGRIKRESFIKWYETLLEVDRSVDAASLDTEEREERAEEEAAAKAAFGKLSQTDAGISYIDVADFGKLIESLGTTYCEEEHAKTVEKLKKPGGRVLESDFLAWYIGWLFSGENDENEEDETAKPDANAAEKPDKDQSLETIFNVDMDSWKCSVCLVRNKAVDNACVACETPRPGHDGSTGNAAKAESSVESSIGSGGFMFGGATGASIGTSGFCFGGSSSAAKATVDESKSAPSGFVFGATQGREVSGGASFGSTERKAGEVGWTFGNTKDDNKAVKKTTSSEGAPLQSVPSTTLKPLLATSKQATKHGLGASSFPPMAEAAPSLFSAVQSTQHAGKSTCDSSPYPPLSKMPPKPFSALQSPQPVATSHVASNKLPMPQSTAPPATKATGPSSFSSKPIASIPTTQSGAKGSIFTSAHFPPMATAAPKPFSAQQTLRPVEKPIQSSPAAFPPMSKAPPTPFSVDLKSQSLAKSNASTTASSIAKPSGGSSAVFPPMSKAPPTPFSVGPQSKPLAKTSSGTTASSVAKVSGVSSAAFPPMSAAPPTPFSLEPKSRPFAKPSTGSQPFSMPSTGTTAGFPPMGTEAPKPFSMQPVPQGESKPSTPSSSIVTPTATESNLLFGRLDSGGISKTKAQLQFDSLAKSLNRTISKVRLINRIAHDVKELQSNTEELVKLTNHERTKLLNVDDSLRKSQAESVFILSRKTDSSRQVDDAAKLVEIMKVSDGLGSSSLFDTQPLDNQSEKDRRRIVAAARHCARRTAMLRGRAEMVEACSSDTKHGYRALLEQTMALFKESKSFDHTQSRIEAKVFDAEKKSPLYPRLENRLTGQSTYSLDDPQHRPSKDDRIGAKPLHKVSRSKRHMMSNDQNKIEASRALIGQWRSIESSLQKQNVIRVQPLRFEGLSAMAESKSFRSSAKRSVDSQKLAPSLLMSPSRIDYASTRVETPSRSTTSISIFSPPSSATARSGWDRPATIDQSRLKKLSIAPPNDLMQTTLLDVSRGTLASFGTTPEKLQTAFGINRNETVSTSFPRAASLSSASPSRRNESKMTSTAAFPPLPSKGPPNPFSKGREKDDASPVKPPSKRSSSSDDRETSNPGFPPVLSNAPANQLSNDDVKKKASSSYPPMAVAAPKPFPSQAPTGREEITSSRNPAESKTSSSGDKEKAPFAKNTTSVFGDMQSLGDSLLLSGKEPTDSLGSSLFPPSKSPTAGPATHQDSVRDYKMLLQNFYQSHNPGKLAEVDHTLEKFKVRNECTIFSWPWLDCSNVVYPLVFRGGSRRCSKNWRQSTGYKTL